MEFKKEINILGTTYDIHTADEMEFAGLIEAKASGMTFTLEKKIIIDGEAEDMWHVIRHEIVHAMLYESGLWESTKWACNEEIVDWIAMQFPKLNDIFTEMQSSI